MAPNDICFADTELATVFRLEPNVTAPVTAIDSRMRTTRE